MVLKRTVGPEPCGDPISQKTKIRSNDDATPDEIEWLWQGFVMTLHLEPEVDVKSTAPLDEPTSKL